MSITKNVPARFSKGSIINVEKTLNQEVQSEVAPVQEAPSIPAPIETAKVVSIPKNTVEDKNENFLIVGGKYRLLTRPDSGYRVIYRILAEKCNFAKAELYLETHNIDNEQEAKELFDIMLVDAAVLEDLIRNDESWIAHCQSRLNRLKVRLDKGDESAAKTMKNDGRIKDGSWKGNIREMFSVCNGSSSEKATNRNIRKFKEAGLMFMMLPKRTRKDQPTFVTMFPAQYRSKIIAAKNFIFKTAE